MIDQFYESAEELKNLRKVSKFANIFIVDQVPNIYSWSEAAEIGQFLYVDHGDDKRFIIFCVSNPNKTNDPTLEGQKCF